MHQFTNSTVSLCIRTILRLHVKFEHNLPGNAPLSYCFPTVLTGSKLPTDLSDAWTVGYCTKFGEYTGKYSTRTILFKISHNIVSFRKGNESNCD